MLPARSNTNQAGQQQVVAVSDLGRREIDQSVLLKQKTLMELNCTFGFAYVNNRFSHDKAQLVSKRYRNDPKFSDR